MKILKYIVFLFLCISPLNAKANADNTVNLLSETDLLLVGKQTLFLEDKDGKLTIDDILKLEIQEKFQQNQNDIFIQRPTSSVFWLKLTIENKTGKDAWIELGSTYLWHIDYYAKKSDTYELITKTGILRPERDKAFQSELFWLPIESTNTPETVYIKIQTLRPIELPIHVGSIKALSLNRNLHQYLIAGFIGLMFSMFIYNLFLLTATRDKLYIVYLCYLLSSIPTALFSNNYPYFFSIFNEDTKNFLNSHPFTWLNISFVFVGFFTIHFLRLNQFPLLKRFLVGYILFFLLILPMLDFFEVFSHDKLVKVYQPLASLYMLTLLGIGLFMWLKANNKNARFFLLAWVWIIIGVISYFLIINGVIEYNIFNRSTVLFGIGLESIFFSIALADRINTMRIEKESAKNSLLLLTQKQNQNLEERIQEKINDLIQKDEILEMTSKIAMIGGWELELASNTITWSSITKEIHEVSDDYIPKLETAINFYKEGRSRDLIVEAVDKCIHEGLPYNLELQLITAKGKEIWARSIGHAEFENGKCKRIYGTFQDITKDKLFSEELQNLNEFQKILLDGNDYAIISTNADGTITTFNKGAEKMLGYQPQEVIGFMSPASFHDKEEVVTRAKILSQELNTKIEPGFEVFVAKSKLGKTDTNEWTYIKKDNSRITVELSVTILRDKKGKITGFLGIAKDISESKKLREDLIRAKEEAEAANLAKSEFLANMTHELRTPLNGVIGFSDILIKTKLDEEQKMYMATLHRSATSLLDLINDILDFSKIEAGKLELELLEVDLQNLLAQVIDIARYKAEEKSLLITLELAENAPRFLWTDPIRLRQILVNLLGNAIKFTDQGQIEIKVEVLETNEIEKQTKFLFSVKDTGIGISEENQTRIFQSFTQADSSTSRKYGGSGLGLSISNQLLSLLNSKLELKAELGKGSTFYFNLWANTRFETENKRIELIEEEKNRSDIFAENKEVFKILTADDNPINQLLMKSILHQILPNAIIFEANNGQIALEIFQAESPDIIFMDIQMPEMNGYESTKAIRKTETGGSIPIIALTAGTVKGERERCETAGMNDYLTKPIVKKSIENTILKWLIGKNSSQEKKETKSTEVSYLHYNENLLKERLEGDEEFLLQLMARVKSDIDSDFSRLKEGFSEKNLEKVTSAAHKIKGTALTLCFEYLAYLTLTLESQEYFEQEVIEKLIFQIEEEIALLLTLIPS